jgi:hypothetical protein
LDRRTEQSFQRICHALAAFYVRRTVNPCG